MTIEIHINATFKIFLGFKLQKSTNWTAVHQWMQTLQNT